MYAPSILSIDALCMHEHHVVCAINVVMDATSASSVSGEVVLMGMSMGMDRGLGETWDI